MLEVEYNIRRRHPESPEHYARFRRDSERVRATTPCRLDLRYGPAGGERLDFFPAQSPHAPLFLFIHGGYWRALDKSDFSFIAPAFVSAGVAVALINYDLAPRVEVEEIVAQSRRAIGWVFDNAAALGFDRARMFVGGHSAGGHLTAMALCAELPLPIAGAIMISGVFNLVPLLRTNVNVQLRLDDTRAKSLSPLHLAHPSDHGSIPIPLLIAVGGAETEGFIGQSRAYAEVVGAKARIYPQRDHYTIMVDLARQDSDLHRDVLRVLMSPAPVSPS